nr:MAG TPA: hypothetical protein [Caudoviricetes sp.]DAR80643.1 MAG TPA: hypothetical protein [Caudoviricetes sp.]
MDWEISIRATLVKEVEGSTTKSRQLTDSTGQ